MKYIPNSISSTVGRQLLRAQKHSPTMLFAAGTVGVVATAVLAARATLQLGEVIDHTARDLEAANDIRESGQNTADEDQKVVIYIRTRGYLEIVKLYAPTVIVGVATISALSGSHNILTRRNAGLTAAYKALEKTFDDYRRRVSDEFGKEKETEIRRSIRKEVVANDKGKSIELDYVDPNGISQYARFFDEYNENWGKRSESNKLFLTAVQNHMNEMLWSRGHVLLNDVYEALGMDRSSAGCVVGWTTKSDGDQHIDFGMYNPDNEKAREFVNGNEASILLDFNVDGLVYDKI